MSSSTGTSSLPTTIGRREFIGLISMLMALTALAIDMILPAFGAIRDEFGLAEDSTAPAAIVTFFFLGLASAQMVYGPLADRFGRKPVLYAGLALYATSAAAAAFSPSLEMILASRFLWGLGAAAPRVVTLSVVRDTHRGEEMAKVMSFIMAIFVLVPIVAPTIGAAVVAVAHWRWVFGVQAMLAVVMAVWASRLPETLDPANRLPLRFGKVIGAIRFVVTNRQTLGYTIASTFLFGAFFSYLASSELILSDVFDRGAQFPLVFGGLAAVMGTATLVNGKTVGRVGVRRISHVVLTGYLVAAATMVVAGEASGGVPGFWLFLVLLAAVLGAHALLLPNMNTLAMGPMGAVAGVASAVIGTISTAFGALLGSVVDRAMDGTVLPLAFGFLGYGLVAMGMVLWAERGRLFTLTPV